VTTTPTPTEPDNSRQSLNISQLNAIDMLVAGRRDDEVAEAVGVSRTTVTDWRNHNVAFAAALNQRRNDVWGTQVDRLRSIVAKAVDVLEEDLNSDDEKLQQAAAIHLLKTVGLYSADLRPIGPTSESGLEKVLRLMGPQ